MAWKECNPMTERMKFVSRLLEGERMTDLCREFGISRKTGYKFFHRYQSLGIVGLKDMVRCPGSHPNQTKEAIEKAIVQVRKEHPTWGAPKIKAYLEKRMPESLVPARSTVHAILVRNKMVKRTIRKKMKHKAEGTILTAPKGPNDVWCTDFKGQFKLKNGKYCYPLTVTDLASRMLLECEGLECISENETIDIFDKLFRVYGLPKAIRSDNGPPFAAPSYFTLSKLSVFWLRLGIKLQRIKPGHPEQNGSHERMHKTLKAETTKPPAGNFLSQQEKFDSFREVFNNQRPHQALDMKSPIDLYKRSEITYDGLIAPLEYPDCEDSCRVDKSGSIRKNGYRVYIGVPFSGYVLGLKYTDADIWKVSFMEYELGFFDMETQKLSLEQNPFFETV